MTVATDMLLLFSDEVIDFPPPQTFFLISEDSIQLISEDGNKLISE